MYHRCAIVINGIKIEAKDFIYPCDNMGKKKCQKNTEAASVLNQMILVLGVMKDDFENRRKNLMNDLEH